MTSQKVGIIGCGSIGKILSEAIISGKAGDSDLITLFDVDRENAEKLQAELKENPSITSNFDDFLDEDLDIVVEVASQKAVKQYAVDILKSGKDMVVLSSGVFSDEDFLKKTEEAAKKNNHYVHIPSGAVLGLDGVQAGQVVGLDEIKIKTRKPASTLSKTKYVKENNLELSDLEDMEKIFEGPASEAVKAFPGSVNVAASLSLAGEGMEDTKVEILADPSIDQNIHEISVNGEVGELTTKAVNFPSPKNPKTSYLAALSAVRLLKKIKEPIKIGT